MGLFKKFHVDPSKIYEHHQESMQPKDGKKHVLIATEPCNGEISINKRANGLVNGIQKHGYDILKFYVDFHLTSQFTMIITYK